MKPFSRVLIASIFLLLILTSLFPVVQSTSTPPSPGPGFEEVYVVIKDRERLESEDNNEYLLELEVIGNYGSEEGGATLSDGEILLANYDKSKRPAYHELDDGDVLQIDFNLIDPRSPIYLPDKYDRDTIITISSVEKTTVPPSLWKYHTPPLLILTIITAVIVLVIMIILVLFLRRRLKKAKIALENDPKINYES